MFIQKTLKLTKIEALAKASYYKDQFSYDTCKTDPCRTWDIIYRAFPAKKSRKTKQEKTNNNLKFVIAVTLISVYFQIV